VELNLGGFPLIGGAPGKIMIVMVRSPALAYGWTPFRGMRSMARLSESSLIRGRRS
jgi:hypothetical protein